MTRNYPSALNALRQAIFLIFVFCLLPALTAKAGATEREAALKNETDAAALGKIWELGSIKQAAALFEQAAADWEKLGEPRKAVDCLNEIAKLSQMYSDYDAAFRALDRALKLETRHDLIEERIVSASLYALFAIEKSDKKTAQKHSRQALSLSKNEVPAKAKAYAFFANGMFAYYYGTMQDATAFFERSEASARETDDIFIISQALTYVSYAYLRNGNPYRAVDQMNQVLGECEKYDYRKGIALSYFGIAFLNYYINEKQKALDYFQQSDSLFPADFEWMEKARIASAIGLIYLELGKPEVAEFNFQKAIAFYERVDYTLGKITTLTLLADAYLLKSDLIQAKQTYETANELALKSDDKFRLANIKEGLGNVEFRENKFDGAIEKYTEALRIYNEIGVRLPVIENLIGNAYRQKNDYQKAREFYDSALKTNRETKDFLQLSETLYNLAKLDLLENKPDDALARIEESVYLTESISSKVVNANLKSTYISTVFDRYELYINLLMKKHRATGNEDYARAALGAAEKSRARIMLENLSLSEADFTKDADAETVRREKEIRVLLNLKADELTNLLSRKAAPSETDKITGEMNALAAELENIKARLKEQSPVYSSIRNPAPFDAADFQKNVLDENSLLVEFSLGSEESYLWLVSRDEIRSYVLPPRREIAAHIENLRNLLKERELRDGESIEDFQKRIRDAETVYGIESAELSRKLFGQVAEKFANKRLIVVPDAELHYFPVAALPLPGASADEPILVTNEIVTEPSAQTLAVLANSRRQPAPKHLLVFSDPIFTLDDARFAAADKPAAEKENAQTERFRFIESLSALPRLPASKDESEAIVNIVGAGRAEVYAGFAATRENLVNLKTADYRILHFATHGLTDETRPELSGVALSGFDEKGQKLNQLFRIQDIYALNLNADLVVLSACATGSGKHVKGEGLMSLNNAFLQSGAKTVVASLWKVEDGATLELMKHFYGAMAEENQTPAQALRSAQLKLREIPKYRSPFFWAAFTVQGDFRSVPQISGGVFWRYFLPVVPLALFGFYLFRRRRIAALKKSGNS